MTTVLTKVGAPPATGPILSYCIPIMNRAEDLKATLPHNLDTNRPLAGTIEFIVMIFDRDDTLLTWLHEEFPAEIESGYLVVDKSTALTDWHFGRAKNAFANLLKGQLYSSLDGDNFVSLDESRQILDVYERFGSRFLFHHFSGTWGDGTSGRITLGKELYRSVGYDESFMPRQFDDMDLLISVLCGAFNIPLITHFNGGFVAAAPPIRRFIEEERIPINNVVVPRFYGHPPLNPRGKGYLRKNPLLRLMEDFNRNTCFAKNSKNADCKRSYLTQAQKCRTQISALLANRVTHTEKFTCFNGLIVNAHRFWKTVTEKRLHFLSRWCFQAVSPSLTLKASGRRDFCPSPGCSPSPAGDSEIRPPAIAIIIPTRNRRLLLERAINSVLAQTFEDFELIIVDDGSTDRTEDYVLGLRHPLIRYIAMREHVGACRARNEGIAASTAPLVTFLDSDDVYLPDRLAGVVEEFHRSPHLDLFISSFRTVRRNRTTQCSNPSVQLNRADLEKGLVSHAIFIAGSAITVRRRVLAEVGAFDSTMQRMQDRDLLLRLARVTGARLSSRIDWVKYQSPDSISGDRDGYVEALAELIARHPVFIEKYPDTTGYLLARHIFKQLLVPDPAGFRDALALARQYRYFDLGKTRVIAAYATGKRFRRSVRRDMVAHAR